MLNISCIAEISLSWAWFFLIIVMVFQPEETEHLSIKFLRNAPFPMGVALALGGSSELDKMASSKILLT